MQNHQEERKQWVNTLLRVANPMLDAASEGKLREKMIVQQIGNTKREDFSCFEGAARLLCGLSAWLDCPLADGEEKELQKNTAKRARALIAGQVDPNSPDYANFDRLCVDRSQILVDAAFLAQAMLRAPKALVEELDSTVKQHVINAFLLVRKVCPWFNNWILFSALVEAGLKLLTGEAELIRIDYAVRQLEQWYVGDGMYADGPAFAMDYYNSFVIHPMLLDSIQRFPELFGKQSYETALRRSQRYAELQEKMIAADGTFMVYGRSITYRCGAFHLLAELARTEQLPASLKVGAVRTALTAVIEKTLTDASFRKDGFLTIGLCGDQPSLGETYISTGSLYLCSCAFLPLGLPPESDFWASEPAAWSQKVIWSGADFPADHKIEN